MGKLTTPTENQAALDAQLSLMDLELLKRLDIAQAYINTNPGKDAERAKALEVIWEAANRFKSLCASLTQEPIDLGEFYERDVYGGICPHSGANKLIDTLKERYKGKFK